MTRTTRSAAAVLALCLCLPCASHAAGRPAGEMGIRSYPLPGHGSLVLGLPADWKQEFRQDVELPPTIVLSPAKGDEFKVLITPLWMPEGGSPLKEPADLQRLIEIDLRAMLPTAVEKDVAVQTIKGQDVTGYWFLVTDKAPKPGEYPYAVRSGVVVGNLLVSATVLCRSKDTPGIAATIEALRTARQMGK
jgi:hypothetical protein